MIINKIKLWRLSISDLVSLYKMDDKEFEEFFWDVSDNYKELADNFKTDLYEEINKRVVDLLVP